MEISIRFLKPNVHIIKNFFPKGRKQILMVTTMCNSKHLCSYTALEIINLLISKSFYGDTNKLS